MVLTVAAACLCSHSQPGRGLCAPAALHPKAHTGAGCAQPSFPLDRSVGAERQLSSGDGASPAALKK